MSICHPRPMSYLSSHTQCISSVPASCILCLARHLFASACRSHGLTQCLYTGSALSSRQQWVRQEEGHIRGVQSSMCWHRMWCAVVGTGCVCEQHGGVSLGADAGSQLPRASPEPATCRFSPKASCCCTVKRSVASAATRCTAIRPQQSSAVCSHTQTRDMLGCRFIYRAVACLEAWESS